MLGCNTPEGWIDRPFDELSTAELHAAGAGRAFMEPVFVPRNPEAAEDDGWILAYVYDQSSNSSEVVILQANDFSAPPVATIHLPRRVPFGFHGSWVAS